jgi:hypothetical protein
MHWRTAVAAAALVWTGTAAAETLTLESPVEQVATLELYTSHGCNSCPPADAWLRGLTAHPALWRELVPLSFHVDYWDRLGWPDRFARAEFSRRQRDYQRSGGIGTVYTPGFVLNGREWRGWFRRVEPEFVAGPPVGRLAITVTAGKTARMTFRPQGEYDSLQAHFAVLGFGLSSPIGGGENAGKNLQEDFVVLGLTQGAAVAGAAVMEWSLPWPRLKDGPASRRAIAAWVSAPGDPRPRQAVGGWLP